MDIKQVAVRWKSKTFCNNIACPAGTTIGRTFIICIIPVGLYLEINNNCNLKEEFGFFFTGYNYC